MRKGNLIQFSIIFILFILYHYLYILFNQAGTVNSDTIWSYSFSRDIIEGLNISEFSFPPFYYFFDIIISFLPSLLGDHLLHSMIVSPINILIFILFFSSFYKSNLNDDYFKSVILLILATIIVYFLFTIFSLFLGNFFNLSVYPLLIMKNYFFMQGNHGLSAVSAFVISYFFYFRNTAPKNKFYLFFLVFLFSLSDFWFAVYFLPIIGVLFLLNPNKKLLKDIVYLILSSIFALILTYYTNSTLRGYSDYVKGYDLFDFNIDLAFKFTGILSILFIMYVIPFLCIIFLSHKNRLTKFIKCISLGSIVSVFFIIGAEYFSYTNMRYCIFALLLNIILIFEVLRFYKIDFKKLSFISISFLILGYMQILTFNVTDKMRDRTSHFDFREEVFCIKEINKDKNYTIFSSYWPSKIIFESLKRKTNLLAMKWIYNPSWSKLFPESNGIIIVKFEHYPDKVQKDLVEAIESKKIASNNFCNSKLILVENFKASLRN